jgi:hypothetical protein
VRIIIVIAAVVAGVSVDHLYAQPAEWLALQLPYGITLEFPRGWRTDQPSLQRALSAGTNPVDATTLTADASGHLVIFAPPLQDRGEASLGIEIMPTKVSQADMLRLTDADIREAEAREFRPEVERAAANNGWSLAKWHGTAPVIIGGRRALATRYEYVDRTGKPMSKATYSVYLGSRSVNLHVFRQADLNPSIGTALDRMLESIRFALSAL